MKSKIKFKKRSLNKYYRDGFISDINEFITTFSFCFDINNCKERKCFIEEQITKSNFMRTLEALVYLYGRQNKYLSYRQYLDLIKESKLVESSIELLKNIQTVTCNFNVLCFGDKHYETFLYDKRVITKEQVLNQEEKYKKIREIGPTNLQKYILTTIYDIGSGNFFDLPYDDSPHKIKLEHMLNISEQLSGQKIDDLKTLLVLSNQEKALVKKLITYNKDKFLAEISNPLNLHIKILYAAIDEATKRTKNIAEENLKIYEEWCSILNGIETNKYGKYTKYIKKYLSTSFSLDSEVFHFLYSLSKGTKHYSEPAIEKNSKLMDYIREERKEEFDIEKIDFSKYNF